ncbi:MAG TPA: MBL fold metallo-hydrolase [Candidatus Acidoferrum sp.]|jgi:glyoxylase-like metal-dependent hydrolase (beta-lactamase superfamily II)|nr:MBL fold metallo-hydrolase [Candidatus Acidoferrum sp.]
MFFRQIKHSGDNFSYVVADENTREAAVVDPSFNADEIIRLATMHNLNIKYIINTHHHGDHTAGNRDVKSHFGAKIVAYKLSTIDKDVSVADGDTIKLGNVIIKIFYTPGHTSDGICLLVDGKLLTGDTLFVGECGRTDLSNGNSKDMYASLFNTLMKLDDSIEVYPGHDYGSSPYSTIGKERRTNYTLKKRSLDEFVEFMKEP